MGALRGSIAVRRYRVSGKLPRDLRARFVKQLRVHGHIPIDPMSEDDKSAGWVNARDPYDSDLGPEKIFFGERLIVGLRMDVLRAPQSEVLRLLGERIVALEGGAEGGRPLGRRERRQLKKDVERELRTRVFPRIKVVDLCWDLSSDGHQDDTGRLYFWSHSKGPNEQLLELFPKTFGMKLELEGPGRWAYDAVLGAALQRGGDDPEAAEAAVEKARRKLSNMQPTKELLFGFDGLRPGVAAAEEE